MARASRSKSSAHFKLSPPTPEVSYRMSRIRSRETKLEILLRKELFKRGLRYRKNYKTLQGCPDIAFTRLKVAIFCDSAFWHGRDLSAIKRRLGKNRKFWISKLERNVARDQEVNRALQENGWIVMRFWDDEIEKNLTDCADKIAATLKRRLKLIEPLKFR